MHPAVVEVRRGGRVESRHRVALAVCAPDGSLVHAAGDVDQPVYPRSAIKPFQALAVVEAGAADRFGLSERELALACASHSGEPAHVAAIRQWLARLGLSSAALACGPHPPLSPTAARHLAAAGEEPSQLHNNCSGKHAGMLTLALHLGAPTSGYERPEHPVQRQIRTLLAALCGPRLRDPPGIDGCGVPTWPVPLIDLARAAARFATGDGLDPRRAAAARRLLAACRSEPWYLAGTGRACSRIVAVLPDGMVKSGAEGVYLGFFPQARLGVALKVEDGAARASEVALLATLQGLGLLDAAAVQALADLVTRPVFNTRGERVGEIVAAAGFPGT